MFDLRKITRIYLEIFYHLNNRPNTKIFVFAEDLEDFMNLHGKFWEHHYEHFTGKSEKLKIAYFSIGYFDLNRLDVIKSIIEIANGNVEFSGLEVQELTGMIKNLSVNEIDMSLLPSTDITTEFAQLSVDSTEVSLIYGIKELELTATFFIDIFEPKLWMSIFLTLIFILIGFLVIRWIYKRFSNIETNLSVSDTMTYQLNFITEQTIDWTLGRSLSWKLLTMTGFFFRIMMMVAFNTFVTSLLPIMHYEFPIKNLNDFTRKKTHKICHSFATTIYHDWKDIVNPKICDSLIDSNFGVKIITMNVTRILKFICKERNIAVAMNTFSVPWHEIPCKFRQVPIPTDTYINIRNGFPYREFFNRKLLQARDAGLFQRSFAFSKNLKQTSSYSFMKNVYEVENEGIQIEHLRLIFLAYVGAIFLAIFVLMLEIACVKIKECLVRVKLRKLIRKVDSRVQNY